MAGVAATLASVAALLTAPVALAADGSGVGIHTEGTRLVEADGTELVLRGISHAHTWYASQTRAFADISDAGANAVRVVLSDGTRWTRNGADDVAAVIDRCWDEQLVCVLEDHDTTGYGEEGAASTLATAADYWVSLLPVLAGTEDHVIINLGNEPYGNDAATNERWADDTIAAIQRLRTAGFEHTILVDAPNWGQDWAGIMKRDAAQVAAADPQGDVVFSVHMYGVYDTAAEVRDYLDAFIAAGLPLVVGEFGFDHSDGNPDEDTIMSYTRAQGIGWFAWSWSGNGGGVEYLDMVTSFDPAQRTSWGTRVITGPDGLAQTSVRAAVFGGGDTGDGDGDDGDGDGDGDGDDGGTEEPTGACTAVPRVSNTWQGGYQAEVVVTAAAAIGGWTVSLGVTPTQIWGAALTGQTASNESWNGSVGAGTSTTFGFLGSGTPPAAGTVPCAA
ncbi:glycoside hydrolase family 5 [Xylanimonas cellulosilytica DSM 15894]|uniref:Endoglucanase n=1 Tax=Xylanimonas cellulosilytica (strain DSM 15894 / JCM 12276 / CECT 5975 / KCTC 9989 / LMG 20990 / NBRC 107835 / XIL07) TaxID=446471 RepID=D1BW40_XYLCX|nr:glycoside hydrolase family 5 [Xylanimonas cellulosilytica DSM 15894]